MSEQRELEQRIGDWLQGEARGELPDWVLDETFEQTRATRQEVTVRTRLRSLRPFARGNDEPEARRGFTMFTAMRAAVVALLIGVVGLGAALVLIDHEPTPAPPASESTPSIEPTPLLDLTFDGEVIPQEFVGVLFSRKTYPSDQEIAYGPAFLPPNTFIRYIESGELGIRPNDDTQVIRASSTQDEAEVVAAGDDTVLGPGDAFIQRDVPWEEYREHALGEMWTPGDDAVIFSLAIRESARCCAMGHEGMVSRWYHTLTSGVQDLSDAPMRFRVQTWEIPVGESLSYTTEATPTLWVVDAGEVLATTREAAASGEATASRPTMADSPIWAMSLNPDTDMLIESVGEEPAVLYQLIVDSADVEAASDDAAPVAFTSSAGTRMGVSRSGHEATVLPDGRVLVTGGGYADVEVFDPSDESFEPAGRMARIRSSTASLLRDGRVLLAGGGEPSSEIWDPATEQVSETGAMVADRTFHTATTLQDGRVLIAGGETSSAEVFDPQSESFTATGDMASRRSYHAATLLDDGRVLVTGGGSGAEIYDPETGEFTRLEPRISSLEHHTMTRLADGRVLIAGDSQQASVFDPASDTFEHTEAMVVPRMHHAATLLPDGRVMLVGGLDAVHHEPTWSIEVFDPASLSFGEVGSLLTGRMDPTASTLADGRILVTGGTAGSSSTQSSTELIAAAEET